jgi:hypothetical protein
MHSSETLSDPLDSPHPIPWAWILSIQNQATDTGQFLERSFRSDALIAPDGRYAAYSRIQISAEPEMHKTQITSVLFVEYLPDRDLATVTATSPIASLIRHPEANQEELKGMAAVIVPISWSQTGDRLLSREFETALCSDYASDYAVVWDQANSVTYTLSPGEISYSQAVLLGWSHLHPNCVLFKAGMVGDVEWPQWTVDLHGRTQPAIHDQPQVFGKRSQFLWSGAQPF